MTNQEAIEIINRENNPNDKEVWDTFPEYREALDMAINSLSAIEDIKQEIEKAMGEYYYSEHDLGVRQGFRFALEIIDKHTKGESK